MRKVFRRLGQQKVECTHLNAINDVEIAGSKCPQCVAAGDSWVHLRICMTCGQVGCCDSSKNKHAHKHADAAAHPIIRSIEPGESWLWCFVDDGFVTLDG